MSNTGILASHTAGAVRITITHIRAGIYRVDVSHNCTGGRDIEELSCSYLSEATARGIARNLYRTFRTGITVQDYLKELTA